MFPPMLQDGFRDFLLRDLPTFPGAICRFIHLTEKALQFDFQERAMRRREILILQLVDLRMQRWPQFLWVDVRGRAQAGNCAPPPQPRQGRARAIRVTCVSLLPLTLRTSAGLRGRRRKAPLPPRARPLSSPRLSVAPSPRAFAQTSHARRNCTPARAPRERAGFLARSRFRSWLKIHQFGGRKQGRGGSQEEGHSDVLLGSNPASAGTMQLKFLLKRRDAKAQRTPRKKSLRGGTHRLVGHRAKDSLRSPRLCASAFSSARPF